jgi:hypothetical protein
MHIAVRKLVVLAVLCVFTNFAMAQCAPGIPSAGKVTRRTFRQRLSFDGLIVGGLLPSMKAAPRERLKGSRVNRRPARRLYPDARKMAGGVAKRSCRFIINALPSPNYPRVEGFLPTGRRSRKRRNPTHWQGVISVNAPSCIADAALPNGSTRFRPLGEGSRNGQLRHLNDYKVLVSACSAFIRNE